MNTDTDTDTENETETENEIETVYSEVMGENIPKDEATWICSLDSYVTAEYINDNLVWCSYNEDYYLPEDCVELPSGEYCLTTDLERAGYAECSHYSTIHSIDDMTEINGNYYCQRYIERYCYYCEHCDEWQESENPCDCSENQEDSRIADYSYRPSPRFYDASTKSGSSYPYDKLVYCGYELEIELDGNSQERICDVIERSALYRSGKIYLKHDGSLNNGIEIVSHPIDPKTENWGQFRELCQSLQKAGCKSYEPGTCGLHVHLSRLVDPLGSKLEIIVDKLEWWLRAVSKRKNYQYCEFPSNRPDRSWRYRALNHLNDNTLELRFFRGTLNAASAINSIKLCYELGQFAARSSESHLKLVQRPELLNEFRSCLPPYLSIWCENRVNGAIPPEASVKLSTKLLKEIRGE